MLRSSHLLSNVSIVAAGALLAFSPIAARAAGAGRVWFPPIAHAGGAQNTAKVTHAVLPFAAEPVVNADKTPPSEAMVAPLDQLDQMRSYVPKSIAGAPNFAEAYQTATQTMARYTYQREQSDRVTQIFRGNPDLKRIALTFDDGPHGDKTIALLNELKQLDVPATFFVVGKQAVKFPAVVQLEVIDGNEVGNHTYDHVNLTKIAPALVPYELDECDSVLRHIIGTSPRFFRPPGGDVNQSVAQAAASHGYITTLWTDDPGDFNRLPGDEIYQRVMEHLQPGGIILLHDGIPGTMEMLPKFVAEARKQGYTFVTMSQLAAERGAVK